MFTNQVHSLEPSYRRHALLPIVAKKTKKKKTIRVTLPLSRSRPRTIYPRDLLSPDTDPVNCERACSKLFEVSYASRPRRS